MGGKTANYQLDLPVDSDYTDQLPYNGNFEIIDRVMKQNEDAVNCITPQVSAETINSAALAEFYSGIKTGAFAADVLGDAVTGVLRAYALSATDAMQILETVDGSRYTRHYTSGAWTSWI